MCRYKYPGGRGKLFWPFWHLVSISDITAWTCWRNPNGIEIVIHVYLDNFAPGHCSIKWTYPFFQGERLKESLRLIYISISLEERRTFYTKSYMFLLWTRHCRCNRAGLACVCLIIKTAHTVTMNTVQHNPQWFASLPNLLAGSRSMAQVTVLWWEHYVN